MLKPLVRALTSGLVTLVLAVSAATNAPAQSGIVAWGRNDDGQCNVPPLPAGLAYKEMFAGPQRCIAIRSNGSIVEWGFNPAPQQTVPPLPPGVFYAQMAVGELHAVALRTDGSVVAWGANNYGQISVPTLPPGVVFVEVAAGWRHTIARLSNGTLLAWGSNNENQLNIPALPAGLTYTDLTAGFFNNAAQRSDGSYVVWGWHDAGQNNIPPLPPGLTYVEIAVGYEYMIGRRSDGTAVAWGTNAYGINSVPVLPIGVKYVELAAGREHAVARRSDGSLIAWGRPDYGMTTVPTQPDVYHRYSKICAGAQFSLGLVEQSAPLAYCIAKTNSLGCTPSIGYTGFPALTGPDDFHVTASNVLNNKFGAMLWSLGSGAVPFLGGTLCIKAPISRTPGQSAFGTLPPTLDCTGTYAFHLSHSYLIGHLLPPGTQMYAQYWSRDKGFAAPNDVGLTDALSFVVFP